MGTKSRNQKKNKRKNKERMRRKYGPGEAVQQNHYEEMGAFKRPLILITEKPNVNEADKYDSKLFRYGQIGWECAKELKEIGFKPDMQVYLGIVNERNNYYGACHKGFPITIIGGFDTESVSFHIDINERNLGENPPESEVRELIIHELLHATDKYGDYAEFKGHDLGWRNMARKASEELGYNVTIYGDDVQHGIIPQRKKYILKCDNCRAILDYASNSKTVQECRKGILRCRHCGERMRILSDEERAEWWDGGMMSRIIVFHAGGAIKAPHWIREKEFETEDEVAEFFVNDVLDTWIPMATEDEIIEIPKEDVMFILLYGRGYLTKVEMIPKEAHKSADETSEFIKNSALIRKFESAYVVQVLNKGADEPTAEQQILAEAAENALKDAGLELKASIFAGDKHRKEEEPVDRAFDKQPVQVTLYGKEAEGIDDANRPFAERYERLAKECLEELSHIGCIPLGKMNFVLTEYDESPYSFNTKYYPASDTLEIWIYLNRVYLEKNLPDYIAKSVLLEKLISVGEGIAKGDREKKTGKYGEWLRVLEEKNPMYHLDRWFIPDWGYLPESTVSATRWVDLSNCIKEKKDGTFSFSTFEEMQYTVEGEEERSREIIASHFGLDPDTLQKEGEQEKPVKIKGRVDLTEEEIESMKKGVRPWKREKPEKIMVEKKGRKTKYKFASDAYEIKEPGPGFDEFFKTIE